MKSMIRNINYTLFISLLIIHSGFAQPNPLRPQLTDLSNFHTIQQEVNNFYIENPTAKGFNQWKRKEWFLEPRLYPSGKMENLTLKTWKEYDRYLKSQSSSRSTHGSWGFLGPTSNATGLGRINAIAFHPSDADIMYIGSANGGVWKTINGGDTWSNITPNIPLLSIADIKLSPSNANVIYILTGDGDPRPGESNIHTQTEVSSIGILRSPDAGATWYPTGFTYDHPSAIIPTKLLIHPSNVNIQYVVSENGIHRTTDNWENNTNDFSSSVIYDIEFKPDNANIMYASGDNEILKSTNGGDDWSTVTDVDFSFGSASRIELAIAPSNAAYVYALVANWGGYIEFLRSNNQGSNNTWASQNTTASTLGQFADYCIALAVDPSDHTDVFGGMQWINRSLDEGVTWTSIVDIVHADIHDVAYRNGALWVCCDGGLYKSTDEGNNWTDVTNGMAITEIYRIAGTPLNNNLYFTGCQDNGTMRRNGNTTAFDVAFGNDGMTPMINYENSNTVYVSWQNGSFARSTTGGGNGSFTTLTIPGGNGNWISPSIMDPVNPDTIFVGTSSVYRSYDTGTNWQNIGNPLGSNLTNCLAQGTSNRNRMYASSAQFIARSDNVYAGPGITTWTPIGAEVPNLFITGIAVDPTNSSRAFVSLSGYSDGEKVYRTTDAGVNWDNISGSLPNVPVNCIVFDENGSAGDALYIGTDIGVFYRDNDFDDWIYFSNSLTPVNISDLYINDADNTVVAGTYGRGLWRSSKYDGCVANISLASLFGITIGGVRFYSSTNSITSSAIYRKDLGTEIHYKAGNVINLTTDFSSGTLGFFEGRIGPCPDIFTVPFMSPFVSESIFIMNEVEKEKTSDDLPR